MRVVLSLALFISTTVVSFPRDGITATFPGDQNAPSVSLRELLNAYQSLYERQFHEPLPENQKALLAALPRFNGDTTHKARKSVEWIRSFQQDDTPKKLEEEPTKTTQIQKRDVTSEPSNETMSTTTASTPTESTTSDVVEVSSTVTETTVSETQTTEAKEEPTTTIPTTEPTSETTILSSTILSTTEIPLVQGRKLAELHPEMKLPIEGKAKPIIVQEVQPSQKTGELVVSADASLPRVTSDEPVKVVLSQPVALMPVPPKEAAGLPKKEAASPTPQTEDTLKTSSASPAPQGISLPLTRSETKKEMKLSVPLVKTSKQSIPPASTLTTAATARTPEVTRKTVTVNRPRVTKPALRQQNRAQQPSLRVVNHFVVPKTETPSTGSPLARRVTSQNRGPQLRRPQPSRRASTPLRATVDGVQTTSSPNKPNIIVIHDGRIVPLTEQQQRDLETILSAMSASGNEASIRRRAPLRRGRVVSHRPQSRQQSSL